MSVRVSWCAPGAQAVGYVVDGQAQGLDVHDQVAPGLGLHGRAYAGRGGGWGCEPGRVGTGRRRAARTRTGWSAGSGLSAAWMRWAQQDPTGRTRATAARGCRSSASGVDGSPPLARRARRPDSRPGRPHRRSSAVEPPLVEAAVHVGRSGRPRLLRRPRLRAAAVRGTPPKRTLTRPAGAGRGRSLSAASSAAGRGPATSAVDFAQATGGTGRPAPGAAAARRTPPPARAPSSSPRPPPTPRNRSRRRSPCRRATGRSCCPAERGRGRRTGQGGGRARHADPGVEHGRREERREAQHERQRHHGDLAGAEQSRRQQGDRGGHDPAEQHPEEVYVRDPAADRRTDPQQPEPPVRLQSRDIGQQRCEIAEREKTPPAAASAVITTVLSLLSPGWAYSRGAHCCLATC